MNYISDELLLEAYDYAKMLNLDPAFIKLLEKEIKRRGL
ncbi:sporulation histidine kinase inhibitor Sda [Salicibibacter cibarius]|uniref:Sporulation histidine kinase inhibitor Sda n=1 Tax=Salicibibacter cibarius TaxID=2743000 RepID=A0A7T6Z4L5_9BACI|nr:sporulation histidine kinase inhibitor Sda [Salicibibacter cibarius]QQK76256.1 sporulation histidine kinase inhibitor Sda [Salicibibacter cibarius]